MANSALELAVAHESCGSSNVCQKGHGMRYRALIQELGRGNARKCEPQVASRQEWMLHPYKLEPQAGAYRIFAHQCARDNMIIRYGDPRPS